MGGCQGCHGVANHFGTNFDFLILEAEGGGGFGVETAGFATQAVAAARFTRRNYVFQKK